MVIVNFKIWIIKFIPNKIFKVRYELQIGGFSYTIIFSRGGAYHDNHDTGRSSCRNNWKQQRCPTASVDL